jgi:hypothetical protein
MYGKREFFSITSILYSCTFNIEFWQKFEICKDGLGSISLNFLHFIGSRNEKLNDCMPSEYTLKTLIGI